MKDLFPKEDMKRLAEIKLHHEYQDALKEFEKEEKK